MDLQKKYPHYVKTKLAWAPEIPTDWHVRKLTHAIGYTVGFTPESGNSIYYGDDFLWANISDLGPRVLNETSKGITHEAVAKYRKWPTYAGSLLYSFKLSVGQVSFAGKDMFTNEAIASFSESEWIHLPFFYYLAPLAIIQNASENIYGAKILNQEAIGNAKLIIPPKNEQQAIARFLDFKTAQIDALIAKKKSLLDKLAEKRTALISHAVTKGLDPTVVMKNSGVNWLGDIPAHWDVKRLKFVGKTRYGLGEPPQKLDGGLPFIRATDIYRGEIDGSKVQTVDPDYVPWSRNPNLKAKDILVVRSGAYTGDSAIVPAIWEGSIAGYDMVYTTEGALPEYIAFNLLSKHVLNGQIYLAKNRAAQPHLNAEELGNVVIALPPPEEQVEVVAYIEEETKRLAIQCDLVNSVVERLLEYRSSMITNAVTGKIDVRGFAIPQPPKGVAS